VGIGARLGWPLRGAAWKGRAGPGVAGTGAARQGEAFNSKDGHDA
jgi:hypothetical protein